jgi:Uncharacterized protein conserved in bacteria
MHPSIRPLGIGILTVSALGVAFDLSQPLPARAATITLEDGATCEGNFRGRTGTGICVFSDVNPGNPYNYYRGQIRNGVPNGVGTFVYQNDDRYEGSVRNGLPNGSGVYIFANGDRGIL